MRQVRQGIHRLQNAMEATGLWLIYPLIGVVVAEVISRYFFLKPLHWVRDVSLWLFAVPAMLTIAHYYGKRMHISAEDLIYRFRLTNAQRAVIDFLHNLIIVGMSLLLFLPAVEQATTSFRLAERSNLTTWRPLVWPFRAVIPMALFMLTVQGLGGLMEAWVNFHKGDAS
jgi:TRAP-type mannitol/chloroaromatic compound transport system permease small subunit